MVNGSTDEIVQVDVPHPICNKKMDMKITGPAIATAPDGGGGSGEVALTFDIPSLIQPCVYLSIHRCIDSLPRPRPATPRSVVLVAWSERMPGAGRPQIERALSLRVLNG